MKNLILVKLGGSLITDKTKPYTARLGVIRRLGREVKKALLKEKDKSLKLVLFHGAGSFAHVSAAKYKTAGGFSDDRGRLGACLVHHDAARINQIVIKNLLGAGLPVAMVAPSTLFVTKDQVPVGMKSMEPVLTLLQIGITPVLYGDVIWDQKRGACIYSGEKSLSLVAGYLKKDGWRVKQAIQVGIEDGVYQADKGKAMPLITTQDFDRISLSLQGSHGTDVTGGMRHKVEEALRLAQKGIETLIINGKKKGNLEKAILGRPIKGTRIKQS